MSMTFDPETSKLRKLSPEEQEHNRRYDLGRRMQQRSDEIQKFLADTARVREERRESERKDWSQRLRWDALALLRSIDDDYAACEQKPDREIARAVSDARNAVYRADYRSATSKLRWLGYALRQQGWAMEESAAIVQGTLEAIPDGCDSIEEALRCVNESRAAMVRERGERDGTD